MPQTCKRCQGLGYLIHDRREHAVAEACDCQQECEQCRGTRFVVELVEGYEVAKRCECSTVHQRVGLFNSAQIPARYGHKNLSDYTAKGRDLNRAKTALMRFTQDFDPDTSKGFLLVGPPATGKTHLITAVLNYLTLQRGIACSYEDFFSLTARIRATYDGRSGETEADIIDPLVEVPVLAVDELGKGKGSDWEITIIDQIVNRRYNAGRIILAASNHVPEEWMEAPAPAEKRRKKDLEARSRIHGSLEQRVGLRVFRRLQEMCDVLKVPAEDWRRAAIGG